MAQPALIPADLDSLSEDRQRRAELVTGLTAPAASISPKYFYDALGSKLFEAICALPEYYPTRTEAAPCSNQGLPQARSTP